MFAYILHLILPSLTDTWSSVRCCYCCLDGTLLERVPVVLWWDLQLSPVVHGYRNGLSVRWLWVIVNLQSFFSSFICPSYLLSYNDVIFAAILAYRVFRNSNKRPIKFLHAGLHIGALVFSVVGLIAVFDFHNKKGIPNMYSFHSWLGITVVGLFVLQVRWKRRKEVEILWVIGSMFHDIVLMIRSYMQRISFNFRSLCSDNISHMSIFAIESKRIHLSDDIASRIRWHWFSVTSSSVWCERVNAFRLCSWENYPNRTWIMSQWTFRGLVFFLSLHSMYDMSKCWCILPNERSSRKGPILIVNWKWKCFRSTPLMESLWAWSFRFV